jgi:hypothetical protein
MLLSIFSSGIVCFLVRMRKNTHSRPQIALVLWTCAILNLFEKLTRAFIFQIALETILLPVGKLQFC